MILITNDTCFEIIVLGPVAVITTNLEIRSMGPISELDMVNMKLFG